MGGHRWLLGPLICLILATTSARPPECQESPPWSVYGQQPLTATKGKASMLEALLNHYRSYDMHDLEFMIVNSKLSHSQEKFHELQKRVSFPVYQETEEEEVWSVMEGGKDDMYIYDRCGRLTYFIPFPLSILNESPLVSNAILTTYFQNPCGESCDQNKTVEVEDLVKNIEAYTETMNETEQESVVTEVTEQYVPDNETNNETRASNDLFDAIDIGNDEYDTLNSSDSSNLTDYDYRLFNVSSYTNETNSPRVDRARAFFNNIYRSFFSVGINEETLEDANKTSTLNSTNSNDTNSNMQTTQELHHHTHHSQHTHKHNHKEEVKEGNKKKSERCVEADYQVCKNWSKKRLLHAQKCCTDTHASVNRKELSCRNFGKRRCKKIQSILKCCLKTTYTEPTTVQPEEDTVQTTEIEDVVCCKKTTEGKLCRVSSSGNCSEDEERNPSQSQSVP